jgi:hypothetical protein
MPGFATYDGTHYMTELALPCCGFVRGFAWKRHEGNTELLKCPKCGVVWQLYAFRQTSHTPDRFILDWHRKSATPKGIIPRPPITLH